MKLKLGLLLTLFAANAYCGENNSSIFGSSEITQKTFEAYFPLMRALVNLYDDLTHEERSWIFDRMIHRIPETIAQEVIKNPDLAEHFAKSYKSYKDKSDSLINKHYIDILVWLDFITNFFGSFATAWQNLTDEQRAEFEICFEKAKEGLRPEDSDVDMAMQIAEKSEKAAQKEGYPTLPGLFMACGMKCNTIQ